MKANRFASLYASRSTNNTQSKQYTLRMCLLGEAGAGKSSLFHRIKYKNFRDTVDDITCTNSGGLSRNRSYDAHTLIVRPNQGKKINLTVVDTANRERYQSLTAQYYRGANIIVMVCSLDSDYTLTRLAKWHQEAQYYIDETEVMYAVVATKCDLPEREREVSQDLLQQFALSYGIDPRYVFEVSSKTGEGVETMLNTLCSAVVQQFESRPGVALNVRRTASENSALLDNVSRSRSRSDSTNSINSEDVLVQDRYGSLYRCCRRTDKKCVIL